LPSATLSFKRPALPAFCFIGATQACRFVAGCGLQRYIVRMVSHRQPVQISRSSGALRRLRRIVLADHARLPWRFFGRLTAAVQAGL
jgi:hypothetical protein